MEMPKQFATIGERVKFARESCALEGQELAAAIGITKQAISAIENGITKNPKPQNLLAIADATGFEFRWLITEEGPPTTKEAARDRLDISRLSPESRAALRAVFHSFSQQGTGTSQDKSA